MFFWEFSLSAISIRLSAKITKIKIFPQKSTQIQIFNHSILFSDTSFKIFSMLICHPTTLWYQIARKLNFHFKTLLKP